jgi:hypothetical protein
MKAFLKAMLSATILMPALGLLAGALIKYLIDRVWRTLRLRLKSRLLTPLAHRGEEFHLVFSTFIPYTAVLAVPRKSVALPDLGMASYRGEPVALMKDLGDERYRVIRYNMPVLPSNDWKGGTLLALHLAELYGGEKVRIWTDDDFLQNHPPTGSAISLGSGVSNRFTQQVISENVHPPMLVIDEDAKCIRWEGPTSARWPTNAEDARRNDYGAILLLPWQGRHVLVIAGLGGGATQGLAEFIVGRRCRRLLSRRSFRELPVGLVIAFPGGKPNDPCPVARVTGHNLFSLV